MTNLDLYVMEFRDLHVNRCKGKTSPHKAILLLSVIDLVEKGHYTDNLIYLDDVLVSTLSSENVKLNENGTFSYEDAIMTIEYDFWS